jgi:hypothetical protein
MSLECTAGWCRGSEVESCRERFGVEARSARRSAMFVFLAGAGVKWGLRRSDSDRTRT